METRHVLACLLILVGILLLAVGDARAQDSATDYDSDDDGLIEVADLAQLNAIRRDLDDDRISDNLWDFGTSSQYPVLKGLALSDPGADTAPLSQPQTGEQTYYFPHLAVGASWQTTITLINFSPDEVTCQTDFISDHGSPLLVSFPSLGSVISRTDLLPPGGSIHEQTDVELSARLAAGWARATCSGPVKASLLFRQHDSDGTPVAEAGVNAATVPARRFVTFAEQAAGQAGTGVAYANPSTTATHVTFTAKDAAGQTLASVVRTLLPDGHDAQTMAPLFGLTSFTGSLEVTSKEPIVSVALNFEAAPVFSSLPPGELDTSTQGSTAYYFPHLAVGAGWQTTITYINYSSEEVRCQTDFLSDQGTPLLVSFAGRGTMVSRTDVLPPRGSVHEETNVDLSAPLVPGWARATCSGPVKASLLFRQYDSEGAPIGEAGVNATTVPASRFISFAEQREGGAGTGVAYANPSATAVQITFTARDSAGQALASVDRTLLANGHGAQNMAGLFGLSRFTGSLEITSTKPIVTLSLNFEAAPVFSSLPPGDIVDPPDMPATEAPDLVVQTPSVSDSNPNAGESFVFTSTVRNQGSGASTPTTQRYYRSPDALISTNDTEVGMGAVSGLSASGAIDQSIRLTAPSAAGTYYYGACVDPVSGESATGNNCSSAVPVRVITGSGTGGLLAGENFGLEAANDDPGGITFANGRFYVADWGRNQVFAYTASGQRDAAADFDLDPDNSRPEGIAFANGRFHVVDRFRGQVFAYTASGRRDAAAEFDLGQNNGAPKGITFANGRFYVVDGGDYKVYAYTTSGERAAAADFDLDPHNIFPEGITFANGRLHVVDAFRDQIFAYTASGRRDAAAEFHLASDNGDPEGITFANGRLHVVDGGDDKVYAYTAPGQREAATEFDLESDSVFAEGITFANGRFYVTDGVSSQVLAYTASGQRDTAADFDLDRFNSQPRVITFANGRFYVVDFFRRDVYAYTASGQRDAAAEFDLAPDNSRPEGITFTDSRFYVVDSEDGKVYAYTASGQRDAAADFDLAPDNGAPQGITFANGRFYVADWIRDQAYAYTASGQRDAAADFDLGPGNDRPDKITFAYGRFYVLDRTSAIYAYTASGQRDAAADFDLAPNGNPEGIAFANGRLHVPDEWDDKVFAYTASGQRDAAADFDLDPDNDGPRGIAFANGRFHVVDFFRRDVFVYSASGQRDAAADFDLAPDNRSPTGITFTNGRFYVVDQSDDKVYAYTASGQRDAAADFDLAPDNGNPQGITSANGRLHVVDVRDEKVYAYTVSGQRAAAADFELYPANDGPLGITFANDRFYVVHFPDGKVYMYPLPVN